MKRRQALAALAGICNWPLSRRSAPDGHTELAPKRLEILKEIVTNVSSVAVMFNPRTASSAPQWTLVQRAAKRLSLTVVPAEIGGAPEVDESRSHMVDRHEKRIAGLAMKARLASIGTVREFAEHGLLIAYGTNFTELWRRCAAYVDKIYKGAKPADLPIEHPTKFDLVINLKTAKALGVTIGQAILARADHVIQ